MSARAKRPTDEVKTEVYDPLHRDEATDKTGPPRAQSSTAQGYARSGDPEPPRNTPESLRAVSLKTPKDVKKKSRRMPQVQIRSIGEISGSHTPPRGMGNLAPPRDPRQARTRHARSNLLWGAVALVVAAIVATIVWVLARR
jgi:hypothetical protein